MKSVLITESIHPEAIHLLEQSFKVIRADDIRSDTILSLSKDCSGMLVRVAKITGDMMRQMPHMRVIAKHGIGVDNLDVGTATEQGIAIVNTPTANVNAVAEHALALLLALMKNIVPLDSATRSGAFSQRNSVTNVELSGKTIGFLGLGKIARRFAHLLKAFDMQMYGYDPYVDQDQVAPLGIKLVSKLQLLETVDVLSVHVPLSKDTFHQLSHAEFSSMKKGVLLVNTSRGQVIDEGALVDALLRGHLAGAALDVFETEPPTPENPLLKMSNVVASPHNAALTDIALYKMAMESAEGIVDVLQGNQPQHLVNLAVLN